MYKEALKQKLRFNTPVGLLSIEQLWELSVVQLDTLAVALEEDYNKSKGKSYISKKTVKDKNIKLQFDIVLDILNDKISEQDAQETARANKEHNNKVMELINQKKDKAMAELSVEQLEALLK